MPLGAETSPFHVHLCPFSRILRPNGFILEVQISCVLVWQYLLQIFSTSTILCFSPLLKGQFHSTHWRHIIYMSHKYDTRKGKHIIQHLKFVISQTLADVPHFYVSAVKCVTDKVDCISSIFPVHIPVCHT